MKVCFPTICFGLSRGYSTFLLQNSDLSLWGFAFLCPDFLLSLYHWNTRDKQYPRSSFTWRPGENKRISWKYTGSFSDPPTRAELPGSPNHRAGGRTVCWAPGKGAGPESASTYTPLTLLNGSAMKFGHTQPVPYPDCCRRLRDPSVWR